MKRWSSLLAVWAMTALSACAGTATAPDWVSGNSAHYPSSQYLEGTGEGDSREIAADRARVNLAKVFQVSIDAASQDDERYQGQSRGGTIVYRTTTAIDRRIETQTHAMVRGIEIARTWEDRRTATYHALAVLPRLPAAIALRQQIEAMDQATRSYIREARATPDLFLKVADADHALRAQIARARDQR